VNSVTMRQVVEDGALLGRKAEDAAALAMRRDAGSRR
jgi:hypothetical protein